MKSILLIIVTIVMFSACEQQNEENNSQDKNSQVSLDKHDAVEISIHVNHLFSCDVMTTTKNVYNEQGSLIKVVISNDTLPTLGSKSDTLDTHKTYVDANGDEQELDTIINHPKDYQLYISVKK